LARAHSLKRKFQDVLSEDDKSETDSDNDERKEADDESGDEQSDSSDADEETSASETEENAAKDNEDEDLMKQFLTSLMSHPEVEVPNGPNGRVGHVLGQMFASAQNVCPKF
jgi:hypothetical protein